MQLSIHFSFEELIASDTAVRAGIDNTPPPGALANLKILANHLEVVRGILGKPMHISSGYRCPELNQLVGGSSHSAHMTGCAVDFICPAFGNPYQTIDALMLSSVTFDQIIHEFGSWVHFAIAPTGAPMRQEVLTTGLHGTYERGLKPLKNSGPLIEK